MVSSSTAGSYTWGTLGRIADDAAARGLHGVVAQLDEATAPYRGPHKEFGELASAPAHCQYPADEPLPPALREVADRTASALRLARWPPRAYRPCAR